MEYVLNQYRYTLVTSYKSIDAYPREKLFQPWSINHAMDKGIGYHTFGPIWPTNDSKQDTKQVIAADWINQFFTPYTVTSVGRCYGYFGS